jgi:hypothetical protein
MESLRVTMAPGPGDIDPKPSWSGIRRRARLSLSRIPPAAGRYLDHGGSDVACRQSELPSESVPGDDPEWRHTSTLITRCRFRVRVRFSRNGFALTPSWLCLGPGVTVARGRSLSS